MSLAHGRSIGFKASSQKMSAPRAPTPPPLGKLQNEEIQRMNLDLNLLSQKLMDLQNSTTTAKPTVSTTGSPFVSSLRDSTSNATLAALGGTESVNFSEMKLQILEKIIGKMCELDRFILRTTEPVEENADGTARPARRSSRGVDLSTFPTHLHLIDRLADVHKKAQRVAVVVKHGAVPGSGSGSGNTPPPIPTEVKEQIKSLEGQVSKLTSQLKESEKSLESRSKELNQTRESLKSAQGEHKKAATDLTDEVKKLKEKLAQAQKDAEAQLLQQKTTHDAALKKLREDHVATMESMSKSARIVNLAAIAAAAPPEPATTVDAGTCVTPAKPAAPSVDVTPSRVEEEKETVAVDESKSPAGKDKGKGGSGSMNVNAQIQFFEERLEQEINQKESLIHALLSMATKIQNHCDTTYLTESECQTVCPDVFRGLDILQSSIIKRLDEVHHEMNAMSQHRDLLESEIKTYSLERELCGQDVDSLNKQVAKLKEEKTVLELRCTDQHLNTNEVLQKELDKVKEQNRQLESDMLASSVQISFMESYKDEVSRMESSLTSLKMTHNDEMEAMKRQVAIVTDENASYKKLTDQLKNKIKELCMKTTGKDRDFLDSFEEVMTEEMMTMKRAFENKLRMAKEESDEKARRHQAEIARMKDSSTSSLALAMSPSAAALRAQYAGNRRVSTEVGYS